MPTAGWAQILVHCWYIEVSGFSSDGPDGTEGTPGDFGFKVLASSDLEAKAKELRAELATGRLAMMAIIGMLFQDRRGAGPGPLLVR